MSTIPTSSGYLLEVPRFERLLICLSLPTEHASEEQIKRTIGSTQAALGGIQGLQHRELAQWDENSKLFIVNNLVDAETGETGHSFAGKDVPWMAYQVFSGKVLQFSTRSELSADVSREVDTLFNAEIQSGVFLPLKDGEEKLGLMCFGSSWSEAHWSAELRQQMLAFANEFSSAMAKIRFSEVAPRSDEQGKLEAEERFRVAIESYPAAVILTGEGGVIGVANLRALDMFGYEREELIGKQIEMLLPERCRVAHVGKCAEFLACPRTGRESMSLELRAMRKDGSELGVEVHMSRVSFGEHELLLSTITDISGREDSMKALIDVNRQLLEANGKIQEMKERLDNEIVHLKQEIKLDSIHTDIVGQSQALQRVLKDAELVAATDSAVLILGETGTGKELIARTIHRNSKRKARMMVNVNCAALPASLVENELFGRERGAYTGALTREIGRFELADRSTIFLDEIGELPLELQGKLLRVLQEGEFERLGSSKTIHVDVRVIAATSRDLEKEVKEGKFREDLYYRLNVFPIRVPPLRERREDIPMIAWHFLSLLGERMGRDIEAVQASTMKSLQEYHWPGNVRELRNVIERSLIINPGPVFVAALPHGNGISSTATSIEEVERNHIIRLLERSGWRIRGSAGAAEALGLKPTTLEARMKKLGIYRK
jgi:PAS domain S-box-containing protein